jgi:hypothetical protein
MANEILNCDVNKICEFFISTEQEMNTSIRKESGLSAGDSDLILSDDHININDPGYEKKEEDNKEQAEGEDKLVGGNEVVETPAEKEIFSPEETKSITEMVNENAATNTEADNLQKNKIELLDYLLSFVDTDKELNYVLAGYFSKFLLHLLSKYPQKVYRTSKFRYSPTFTKKSQIF